ncbi:MAG: nucleotidyltransferase domain-containing protein [Terriglobia bacterium]
MEALSQFDLRDYEKVEEALKSVRDADAFLNADAVTLAGGAAVRFGWPDWPELLRQQLRAEVDVLHQRVPLLRPVAEDTKEWAVVFQAWKSDPESAKEIGEALSESFPGRVRWVFSRRDSRGRVSATGAIEKLGNVSLDLSWKGVSAIPAGQASREDMTALSGAIEKLTAWAGRKITPVLEQLRDRLANLYGDRFRGLYVFGSYAKPDAGIQLPESSDLDVALLLSNLDSPYDEIQRFGDIAADLSLEHGLVISLHPIREADFRQGRTNFTRVISDYAIAVE